MHLGYYSDLLRLLTGQFDALVQKLRTFAPEPSRVPKVSEGELKARGPSTGELVSEPFTVENPAVADAPATFDCSEFHDKAKRVSFSDIEVLARPVGGRDDTLVPAESNRRFTVTFQRSTSQIETGRYEGTVYVRLWGELVQRLRVQLDVEAPGGSKRKPMSRSR
jgi:hypothetical protein